MGIWQKLLCILGYHKPKQTEVKKEKPIFIERRMIGYVGIQLGDSICAYCNIKLRVYREGFFGPGSDLREWKSVNSTVLNFIKGRH